MTREDFETRLRLRGWAVVRSSEDIAASDRLVSAGFASKSTDRRIIEGALGIDAQRFPNDWRAYGAVFLLRRQ